MKGERHPTEEELLKGAIRTIEDVLVPELDSVWARTSAMGLLGQLRYALARSATNSLTAQDAELRACLNALCEEYAELREVAESVETRGDASWDLRERAGRLLVLAQAEETAAAVAVRARLRPLLVAQVGQDLAESGPMLQAFLASGSMGNTG